MSVKKEPIKQREILESRMQLTLLKKSLKKLINYVDLDEIESGKNIDVTNYDRMKELLALRYDDLVRFNIVTYGLAFSSILIFSSEFAKVTNGGMVEEYISLMENHDYWFQTNDETFSVEVAVLFVYQFFLNLYKEIHIDFSIIESLLDNKDELNRELREIIKKIDLDDKLRLSDE